jgi:prepilin-type processing-associated H-X9-DG protein
MLKNFGIARLVAFFAIATSPLLANAQTLADRMPADAILYIGWAGVEKTAPGFAGSHLEAVLGDSNLPKVLDDFIPKLLDRIASEDADAAEVVEVIRGVMGPMWRHPSAIAFAGFEIGNAGPTPRLILLSNAGREAPALKEKIEGLVKKAGPLPCPIHIAQIGDIVAIVTGYEKMETAIQEAGAGAKSLANDPDFIKSLSQVRKDAVVTGYVNVDLLLTVANQGFKMAGDDVQGQWLRARDMLGLSSIKSAIWTEGFDKKDWSTQIFLAVPAPRKGLFASMLDSREVSKDIISVIPKNATMAGATHFDIAALVAGLRRAVAAFDAGTATQIDQAIEQVNTTVGLDIPKDFLGSLGDEWAYYVDPAVAGNGIVGATLVNKLKDPAKVSASIDKLEKFINGVIAEQLANEKPKLTLAFRQQKINQTTVHYMGLPLVEPSWAVEDGYLYVALYPEVVAAAARHVSAKGESIAANPDYVNLRSRLGDHPASTFQFVDLPRLVPNTYSTWLVVSHLTGAGDIFGVPAPLMILPPLNKLMPQLTATGQITWTDDAGLHFNALSPFPGSEILASDPTSMSAAQVPVLISILLPALNKARQQAQQIKSAANLKNMGLAAMIYSNNQKDNAFPKDFAVMLKETDLTIDIFVNPRSNTTVPQGLTKEQQQQWVRENSDYVWNGAGMKASKAGPDDPIAWEKPQGMKNGINILYGDGHVQFEFMPTAMEIIQKAERAKRPPGL